MEGESGVFTDRSVGRYSGVATGQNKDILLSPTFRDVIVVLNSDF